MTGPVPPPRPPPPGRHPLASFVPVAVEARLRQGALLEPGHQHGAGAVLVADVSGSTELASRLAASPGGVEELSAVLNAGLAPVIDAIGAADGDILTFAGDGLTAFWPGTAAAAIPGSASVSASHPARSTCGTWVVNMADGFAWPAGRR